MGLLELLLSDFLWMKDFDLDLWCIFVLSDKKEY